MEKRRSDSRRRRSSSSRKDRARMSATDEISRRQSRIGARKYAPEHFAFRNSAIALPRTPIYKQRHVLILMASLFVMRGGYSLLFASREDWTFPITNDRCVLILHWFLATPFLAGSIFQRVTVTRMAEAGQLYGPMEARLVRRGHKTVGRLTLLSSLGAALTAMLLAKQALAGSFVFMSWSLSWMYVTVMVWRTARKKKWGAHKLWAETLSRTAIAFVLGRVLLALYAQLAWTLYDYDVSKPEHAMHVKSAYYYAVACTGLYSLCTTVLCARAHAHAERRDLAMMQWRKVKYAFYFLLLTKVSMRKQ